MLLPSGARLEIFDRLDSTSAEAKRRAEAGEAGPCWILAREQTSGYGRRSRHWESSLGNFAATYLFEPAEDIASHGQLSYVAALAVIEALDAYSNPHALALKWPNDVLAASKKIAGILLENIVRDGRSRICVGIGVNLRWAPDNVDYPTAKLSDCLRSDAQLPSPEDLVRRIDDQFAAYYSIWRKDGFAPVRTAWIARAKGVGEPVRVRLPGEEFVGAFLDLDPSGALLVKTGDGERLVSAGEIMFGAA